MKGSAMDEQAKKKALRMFTYGLYVIGVKGGDTVHAFTGTWVSQASFQPPLVMVGVSREGRSAEMLRESKAFTISILAQDQQEVAQQFFKCPDPKEGKFGNVVYQLAENGCPVIENTPAYLGCDVVEIVEKGDHWVVLGEVKEARVLQEAPPLALSQTPWKYGG